MSHDELTALIAAARAAAAKSLDLGIEAWRRVVQVAPGQPGPRRELANLLRQAGRWNALVEALRAEEQVPGLEPYARVAILIEVAEVYLDRLHLDSMAVGVLNRVLELQPHNPHARTLLRQLEAKRRP